MDPQQKDGEEVEHAQEEKICTKCETAKSLEDFADDPRKKDGKYSACRDCHNSMSKEWRHKNKDKVRAYRKVKRRTTD